MATSVSSCWQLLRAAKLEGTSKNTGGSGVCGVRVHVCTTHFGAGPSNLQELVLSLVSHHVGLELRLRSLGLAAITFPH